jgi:hypothetical protein
MEGLGELLLDFKYFCFLLCFLVEHAGSLARACQTCLQMSFIFLIHGELTTLRYL